MRSWLCVVMLMLVVMPGCSWFVPGAVKREASLVRLDVETALREAEETQGEEGRQKALKTLKRLKPHVANIDDYMQGRPAAR